MSRRHQSSRRKSYARRQHELRERQERRHHEPGFEFELDAWGSGTQTDPLAFVDPRVVRTHYAGD